LTKFGEPYVTEDISLCKKAKIPAVNAIAAAIKTKKEGRAVRGAAAGPAAAGIGKL
jgi:hypothetical protein